MYVDHRRLLHVHVSSSLQQYKEYRRMPFLFFPVSRLFECSFSFGEVMTDDTLKYTFPVHFLCLSLSSKVSPLRYTQQIFTFLYLRFKEFIIFTFRSALSLSLSLSSLLSDSFSRIRGSFLFTNCRDEWRAEMADWSWHWREPNCKLATIVRWRQPKTANSKSRSYTAPFRNNRKVCWNLP